jgi:hypothetical protein
MRTYSHALLTHAAARHLSTSKSVSIWASLGAVLPDLPAAIGTAWLWTRRRKAPSREEFENDVCGRSLFRAPDAALHSTLPVSAALAVLALFGRPGTPESHRTATLAFLFGWAGHVASDTLTHGTDARPLFWPVSNRRFESPVSYRERARHAAAFTAAEHLAVLAVSHQLSAISKSKKADR